MKKMELNHNGMLGLESNGSKYQGYQGYQGYLT